jgi:hypothetical protein
VISSLRRIGVVVPGALVEMTSDGSGVYLKSRITNDVNNRWYGVGSDAEGYSVENS